MIDFCFFCLCLEVITGNIQVMAESDSFNRFITLMDQCLDQVEDIDVLMACNSKGLYSYVWFRFFLGFPEDGDEDDEVSKELLLESTVLDELRNEAQKLKSWKKLNKARNILFCSISNFHSHMFSN